MRGVLSADAATLDAVAQGDCPDAAAVLGPQRADPQASSGELVRAFVPGAERLTLVLPDGEQPMRRVHAAAIFEADVPDGFCDAGTPYHLRAADAAGGDRELDDPYRFAPLLDEARLRRFVEEGDRRIYEFLGAHPLVHDGVAGTRFAVWAPKARAVNLSGTFNDWHPASLPLRRGESGVWELFVPRVGQGAVYQFEVRAEPASAHRRRPAGSPEVPERQQKADPVGFAAEGVRPATRSVVWDLTGYEWSDDRWISERADRHEAHQPLSIYEVHLGSWRRRPGTADGDPAGWLNYREVADSLLPYVKDMGFTHIELLPVTEHPFDGSWGYQSIGYFAPTSRFGTPDDFRYFVDRAHQLELGVILDWVPAHFPRDPHGLATFDGTHLYDHEDPRLGAHPDWGTQIFDYGRTEVRSFLLSSALFWLDRYHIDGLRVDAVASMLYLDYGRAEGEWVPNEFGGRENLDAVSFVRELNDTIHEVVPGALVFAEESTAWPKVTHAPADGGLGFDMKWKMGWMNDTLEVMGTKPEKRGARHDELTFSIAYAFNERFLLPLSHDEVVHVKGSLLGKMPGNEAERFANLRLLYGYMWAHPGKKLLFMGGELAQLAEWNHDSDLSWELLDRPRHRGIQALVRELNHLYRTLPPLYELALEPEGFEWIDSTDRRRSVLSFLRRARDWHDFLVVVANFSGETWRDYQLGVPFEGRYRVLLDTDAREFGGEGKGVIPGDAERPAGATEGTSALLETLPAESHGRGCSLRLHLPPLSALYLRPEG